MRLAPLDAQLLRPLACCLWDKMLVVGTRGTVLGVPESVWSLVPPPLKVGRPTRLPARGVPWSLLPLRRGGRPSTPVNQSPTSRRACLKLSLGPRYDSMALQVQPPASSCT